MQIVFPTITVLLLVAIIKGNNSKVAEVESATLDSPQEHLLLYILRYSQVGKAADFDSAIRWFESSYRIQLRKKQHTSAA